MAAVEQKTLSLGDIDQRLIFGVDHANLELLEDELDVELVARGDWINIKGSPDNVEKAQKVILDVLDHVKATGELCERYILYSIALVNENGIAPSREVDGESGLITSLSTQKVIKPRLLAKRITRI